MNQVLPRPSQQQVNAARAILKKFGQDHKGTASDTVLQSVVYSIYAALGGPGQPAAEYDDVVREATGSETKVKPMIRRTSGGFEVVGENPLGLSVGKTYIDQAALTDDPEDAGDGQELTAEYLGTFTKNELAAQFDVADNQTKDQMIAEILEMFNDDEDDEPSGD